MGIFDCQISGELTDNELEELRGYQRGSEDRSAFRTGYKRKSQYDKRFPHCEYRRKGGSVRSEKACVI